MEAITNSPLLRRTEVPPYAKDKYGVTISVQRLAVLAVTGEGPQFRKLGRTPYYSPEDIDRWLNERLTKPATSTAAHKAAKQAA